MKVWQVWLLNLKTVSCLVIVTQAWLLIRCCTFKNVFVFVRNIWHNVVVSDSKKFIKQRRTFWRRMVKIEWILFIHRLVWLRGISEKNDGNYGMLHINSSGSEIKLCSSQDFWKFAFSKFECFNRNATSSYHDSLHITCFWLVRLMICLIGTSKQLIHAPFYQMVFNYKLVCIAF